MKNCTILFVVYFLLSSCVSRLLRPSLTGTVADFEGNPIQNCTVGTTKTDRNGYFELSEIRKNKFLLTELFIMEAPPVFVLERIHKQGYEDKEIEIFHKYGGGSPKGTQWDMDTIYLKETSFTEYAKLLPRSWTVATNKKMDTLYLLRSNFEKLCKTAKCNFINGKYYQYTNNYLDSFGPNNLPKGTIRKNISLNLKEDHGLEAVKVIQYGDKNGTHTPLKKMDTLLDNGKWQLNKNLITLASEFEELRGTFRVDQFDYEYMVLTRIPSKN